MSASAPVFLVLTERQATQIAAADTTAVSVVANIRHQLQFRRIFRRVDDAPWAIVLKRRPGSTRLVYAALTFPDGDTADKAFDVLWTRTLEDFGERA